MSYSAVSLSLLGEVFWCLAAFGLDLGKASATLTSAFSSQAIENVGCFVIFSVMVVGYVRCLRSCLLPLIQHVLEVSY